MEIILNGENRQIAESTTAAQLIETLGLVGKRLAMEVNQEIVPRSAYSTHLFQAGDRVEIVRAIGGG